MLPGSHSHITMQQASYAAQHSAVHAAVLSTMHFGRNAALLELADRLVGDLPDWLAETLQLRSSIRRVLISAETQRHAIARRAISSHIDAELVAHRIAEAFANVRYIQVPQKKPNIFALVGHATSADRWLVLPLKFVPSPAPNKQPDELWLRTAIPLGKKNMRKTLANGCLRELRAANAF